MHIITYLKGNMVLGSQAFRGNAEEAHSEAMEETVAGYLDATHFTIREEGGDTVTYDAQDGREVTV